MSEPKKAVCPNCKNDYYKTGKYCRFCGAPKGEPEYIIETFADIYGPPPVKRIHKCVKCGFSWQTREMIDDAKYCPKCGASAPGIEQYDENI